jgi:hypothetical protein
MKFGIVKARSEYRVQQRCYNRGPTHDPLKAEGKEEEEMMSGTGEEEEVKRRQGDWGMGQGSK